MKQVQPTDAVQYQAFQELDGADNNELLVDTSFVHTMFVWYGLNATHDNSSFSKKCCNRQYTLHNRKTTYYDQNYN